jgi:hypothetical protein
MPDTPLTLSQMLAEEYNHIHDKNIQLDNYPTVQAATDEEREQARRKIIFQKLFEQEQAALCLSGGGIRSATFSLGIIQGLARCGLLDKFHYLSTVSGGGYIGSWLTSWIHRHGLAEVIEQLQKKGEQNNSLSNEPKTIRYLRQYSNYLSPKLGFLSADTWTLAATIVRNLLLNWTVLIPLIVAALLLPRLLVATLMNRWVNEHFRWWFVGAVISGIIGLTYTMVFRPSDRVQRANCKWLKSREEQGGFLRWCLLPLTVCCLLLIVSWAGWRHQENVDLECLHIPYIPFQGWKNFALFGLVLALTAGILSWIILRNWQAMAEAKKRLANKSGTEKWQALALDIWASLKDLILIAISGGTGWLLIWGLVKLFPNPSDNYPLYVCFALPLLLATFFLAMSLFVGLSSKRMKLFGKLRDTVDDDDREWLARLCGWVLILVVIWFLVSVLVLYGPYWLLWLTENSAIKKAALAAVGGTSGIITWVLGFGSKTQATAKAQNGGGRNSILSFAAPLFLLLFLVSISLATNWILFQSTKLPSAPIPTVCEEGVIPPQSDITSAAKAPEGSFLTKMQAFWSEPTVSLRHLINVDALDENLLRPGSDEAATKPPPIFSKDTQTIITRWASARVLVALLAVALAIGLFMGFFINVNRFSLHAMYRNRLIRAYLGASRRNRKANPFTGFDPHDNLSLYELRGLCRCKNKHIIEKGKLECDECGSPPNPETDIQAAPPASCDNHLLEKDGAKQHRLLHVVNMALNLVGGDNLAWQQRKAESFTASPLHCGSLELGYRDSKEYAERMSLGTAVAISGAAVSPNMGYHSSPIVTFILTLFNARLGWWLGNPKDEDTYQRAYPKFAIRPFIEEALGLTNDDNPYVYLSDGGHFENLGLYEMVLRRCKYIVVSDAGCDESFSFEDLGNAIRKIRIDLGVQIKMHPKINILPRVGGKTGVYCALGEIDYTGIDKELPNGESRIGWLVYIKPAFYNQNEPMDVVNYATTCAAFPHETTADQFFSESQFESYRKLGLFAIQQVPGNSFKDLGEFKDQIQTYISPPPKTKSDVS